MILKPWLGQNKPPLGVNPIPGHTLRPKFAYLLGEGSGLTTYEQTGSGYDGVFTTAGTLYPRWGTGISGTALDFDRDTTNCPRVLVPWTMSNQCCNVLGIALRVRMKSVSVVANILYQAESAQNAAGCQAGVYISRQGGCGTQSYACR
jgi:hypothetical protein